MGYLLGFLLQPKRSCAKDSEEGQGELANEAFATELMAMPEFRNYIAHNGYHFNDRLADWATKLMENASGDMHNWTTEQVRKAVEGMRSKVYPYVTDGDLAYVANMCYADIFPDIARNEADCLKYAIRVGADPDGYDGMIFNRWLSDVIGKNIVVDWGKVT